MEFLVCIQNLGKYNEGELVFSWVDLMLGDVDWVEEMKNIGVAQGNAYEEYMIADFTTDIKGLDINEYESLDKIDDIAELLRQLKSSHQEGEFKALVEYFGSFEEAKLQYEEGDYLYIPRVNSDKDLGYYLVDTELFGIQIPTNLKPYIDFEKIGREYAQGSNLYTKDGFIKVY